MHAPPDTSRVAPVTKEDSSEARNRMAVKRRATFESACALHSTSTSVGESLTVGDLHGIGKAAERITFSNAFECLCAETSS